MRLSFVQGLLLCLMSSTIIHAQNRKCTSHEDKVFMTGMNEAYKKSLEELEQSSLVQQTLHQAARMQTTDTVFIIPVVVHIVHKASVENISDAQVWSQIAALNADLRRLNQDTANNIAPGLQALGRDVRIEFRLAAIDPDGNPTKGITRRLTTLDDFGGVNTAVDRQSNTTMPALVRNDVKRFANGGVDPWPTNQYLNMWVCNFVVQSGNQLLGYAQFPGLGSPLTDGVVMWFRAFGSNRFGGPFPSLSGSNSLGRTTTHEVGHWLNLRHIWGDEPQCTNDDGVFDTPLQATEQTGCPSGIRFDACTGSGNGIMYQNYMDYTSDNCMNIFTAGQVTRMRTALNGPVRSPLKQTEFLAGPTFPLMSVDAAPIRLINPTSPLGYCKGDMRPVIFLRNWGTNNLTSVRIGMRLNNGSIIDTLWTGILGNYDWTSVELPKIEFSSFGAQTLRIFTYQPNGVSDMRLSNDTLVINLTVTPPNPTNLPIQQSFETNPFPGANWSIRPDTGWVVANVGAFGSTGRSAVRRIFNDLPGDFGRRDTLASPLVTINNALDSLYLYYSYAHRRRNLSPPADFADTLYVLVTDDCSNSWQLVRMRSGPTLSTGVVTTAAFTPTNSEWARDSINISQFIGRSSSIRFAFVTTSRRNNNIYLDDMRLAAFQQGPIGFQDDSEIEGKALFKVYPIPASGTVMIAPTIRKGVLEVIFTDLSGRTLLQKSLEMKDETPIQIDIRGIAAGMYLMHGIHQGRKYTHKLIIE